ncbi:hypothetical protein D3C79_1009310 [compost metagenome]
MASACRFMRSIRSRANSPSSNTIRPIRPKLMTERKPSLIFRNHDICLTSVVDPEKASGPRLVTGPRLPSDASG